MSLPPALAFFDGIGVSELLMVAFVAVLVYGGKLPDAMRSLGRAYAKLRQGLSDMSRPLREEIQRVTTLPPTGPPPASLAKSPPAPSVGHAVGTPPPSLLQGAPATVSTTAPGLDTPSRGTPSRGAPAWPPAEDMPAGPDAGPPGPWPPSAPPPADPFEEQPLV